MPNQNHQGRPEMICSCLHMRFGPVPQAISTYQSGAIGQFEVICLRGSDDGELAGGGLMWSAKGETSVASTVYLTSLSHVLLRLCEISSFPLLQSSSSLHFTLSDSTDLTRVRNSDCRP